MLAAGVVVLFAVAAAVFIWRPFGSRGNETDPNAGRPIQTVRAGDLDVVLLSPSGALRQGRNAFTIEFRRTGTSTLVDVGTVRASANMAMPGMVMSGGLQVSAPSVAGRYGATADFGMAGAWKMAIEWDGPAGKGSVNFEGGVQ